MSALDLTLMCEPTLLSLWPYEVFISDRWGFNTLWIMNGFFLELAKLT